MTTLIQWNIPAADPPRGSYRVFEVGHPDEIGRVFWMLDALELVWGKGTHWVVIDGIAVVRKSTEQS